MTSSGHTYFKFISFASATTIAFGMYILIHFTLLNASLLGAGATFLLPMALDAAIGFVLVGLSLLLRLHYKQDTRLLIRDMFTAFLLIWGLLAIFKDFTKTYIPVNFGMSPQTAFCFICLAVALLFIRTDKKNHFAQWLLHTVSLMSLIAIIGHAMQIPEFYMLVFIPMSIYSAFTFLLISVAASFLNPTVGITGLFTGNLIGNLMARRLFFSMFVAIIAAGYIRIVLHRMGSIGVEFGIALLIVAFCIISLLLIWAVSSILNKAHATLNVARENLHIMVQAAPYALAISDKEGSILEVNKKAEQLFGYSEGEMIGRRVSSLVPENMREMWMQRRSSFLNDPETSSYGLDDEIMVMRKNGTLFPIEIVLTPIHTDQGVRILSFVIDITARRANEETIKRQVIELQHKNEELEQFNYISSHDLQEPLRTVSNYIEMLQEDYPEQVHGEVKEHLDSINSAVSRMLKLVRSLLEFGKLGQDRKMSIVDSQQIVTDVLADLKGIIEANNATVLVNGELPKLYAYDTELRQLFQNLINNAIKFRNKEVFPHITISCKSVNGYYRFSVTDNGIGMPKEHLSKIFNIFQRLHHAEAYEGHGIGLANCKKIAELHGGKIWVQSEPGIGSTFKFTVLKLKL